MGKKLQELKNKIQELVPEIIELKKGCFVRVDRGIKERTAFVLDYSKSQKTIWTDGGNTIEGIHIDLIKRILGRPITLEDVLMAICKMGTVVEIENYGDGMIVISKDLDDEKEDFSNWKLGIALDQQKKDLFNFLHSIICQK